MNAVSVYIRANRGRLRLERFGLAERFGCLLLTPRFAASRHVVFLLLSENRSKVLLVAKLPRLVRDNESNVREARNLMQAHSVGNGDCDSIPKLVALDEWQGQSILLETANFSTS